MSNSKETSDDLKIYGLRFFDQTDGADEPMNSTDVVVIPTTCPTVADLLRSEAFVKFVRLLNADLKRDNPEHAGVTAEQILTRSHITDVAIEFWKRVTIVCNQTNLIIVHVRVGELIATARRIQDLQRSMISAQSILNSTPTEIKDLQIQIHALKMQLHSLQSQRNGAETILQQAPVVIAGILQQLGVREE